MPDPEAVKRLLAGGIYSFGIEGGAPPFSIAERVYGREGFGGGGIQAPGNWGA